MRLSNWKLSSHRSSHVKRSTECTLTLRRHSDYTLNYWRRLMLLKQNSKRYSSHYPRFGSRLTRRCRTRKTVLNLEFFLTKKQTDITTMRQENGVTSRHSSSTLVPVNTSLGGLVKCTDGNLLITPKTVRRLLTNLFLTLLASPKGRSWHTISMSRNLSVNWRRVTTHG